MALVELFLLTVVVCFIVDCCGVMDEIRMLVSRLIKRHLKISVDYRELKLRPFGCSLCMTWWCGLAYLLITSNFTVAFVAYVAVLSLFSSNISGLLLTLKDYAAALECWLQRKLNNE